MFDWFEMDQSTGVHFAKLCDIVAKLRAPGGCPWDREQTHESLLPALLEEAYEVAEAARAENDAHFCEELGDLLLLVIMHAEIAREAGRFDIDKVVREVSDKLVRRHPHVFGTSDTRDSIDWRTNLKRVGKTWAMSISQRWTRFGMRLRKMLDARQLDT